MSLPNRTLGGPVPFKIHSAHSPLFAEAYGFGYRGVDETVLVSVLPHYLLLQIRPKRIGALIPLGCLEVGRATSW